MNSIMKSQENNKRWKPGFFDTPGYFFYSASALSQIFGEEVVIL